MKIKRVVFWCVVVMVAFMVIMSLASLAVMARVHVGHDLANNFRLEKAGWNVPELRGAMLPVQCAGLSRRGQWVCANYYYGSAAMTLEHKDVWGKRVGENPCAYFRSHLRLLEQTEYNSISDWRSFKIGLAACETV